MQQQTHATSAPDNKAVILTCETCKAQETIALPVGLDAIASRSAAFRQAHAHGAVEPAEAPVRSPDPWRRDQKIERRMIESSNLASMGFLPDGGVVEVEFRDGSIYRYHGVPEAVFASVIAAPSVGVDFHSQIVKARFPTFKVQAARPRTSEE